MKIYTIQNTENGVAYPGAGKLWVNEDNAIDFLIRHYAEERGQTGLSRDQFIEAMRAGKTFEHTQVLYLVDDIGVDEIPATLWVRMDWVWGNDEDQFYTAVSAQVSRDDLHRDEWTVQHE